MGFEDQHPVSDDRKKYTENEARLAEIKKANIGDFSLEDIVKMKEDEEKKAQENQDLHGKAYDEAHLEEGEREQDINSRKRDMEIWKENKQYTEQMIIDAMDKVAQNEARLAEIKEMKVADLEIDQISVLKEEELMLIQKKSELQDILQGKIDDKLRGIKREDEAWERYKSHRDTVANLTKNHKLEASGHAGFMSHTAKFNQDVSNRERELDRHDKAEATYFNEMRKAVEMLGYEDGYVKSPEGADRIQREAENEISREKENEEEQLRDLRERIAAR